MSHRIEKDETAGLSPSPLLRLDPLCHSSEVKSDLWCPFAFQDAMRIVDAECYGTDTGTPQALTA